MPGKIFGVSARVVRRSRVLYFHEETNGGKLCQLEALHVEYKRATSQREVMLEFLRPHQRGEFFLTARFGVANQPIGLVGHSAFQEKTERGVVTFQAESRDDGNAGRGGE